MLPIKLKYTPLVVVFGAFLMIPAVPAQAAPPVQALSGFTHVGDARYYGDRRARTRVRVYRGYAGHDFPYGRPVRGFYDRNPTYQGNINGCVVDLGYGRYESCNVGR